MRIAYGKNEIDVQIQSIGTLLVLEVLNPFYFFQVFTICVWVLDEYYYYSIAIIIMSVFGISSSILQTHRNQVNLYKTIHSSEEVTIKRKGKVYENIQSTLLVPGDVIALPSQGCIMQCDAVLLEGHCIVNESMLTGESVPVTKTALPKNAEGYSVKEDTNHTLFCGTHVLQTRYYNNERVHAVVIRTGFYTTKGNLVRSILYPPPADFKFDQDSYKFIWILAAIGISGFIHTVVTKLQKGMTVFDSLIKGLDILTITIPPALPAAMTVGKLHALNRLKKQNISCINSRVINVSGSLNCLCFDKTGTLTEDGLDMWGCIPVVEQAFDEPCIQLKTMDPGPLLYGMATCHSLTLINGNISGDPLDLKMFESTGWVLDEPKVPDSAKYNLLVPTVVHSPSFHPKGEIEIGILHQFQFSSKLQRMSVVTRELGSKDLIAYCKGSPEMIISLSKQLSVPEDSKVVLQKYTEQGFRVLAIGCKKLTGISYHHLQRIAREEIENDLELLGFVVLENRLKPQTIPTINLLKQAKIKIVMITGDNIQTAMSVALECGLVKNDEILTEVSINEDDEIPKVVFNNFKGKNNLNGFNKTNFDGLSSNTKLAITGKTWATIREKFPNFVSTLLKKGAVFARMSSDQKQQVIVELQLLGFCVGMCGDGANDCGALKAANVGISLSDAEASVASPFTSREPNITCVKMVISEGRAALTTSFGVFKFMVLYSLTEFMSVMILYSIGSNLTDFQFLFIDIALIVNFAFFFGKNEAYKGPLVKEAPLKSILHLSPILSLTFQAIIMFIFQISSFYILKLFPWYTPFVFQESEKYDSYENYAVYTVSQFQYIIMTITFSQGPPFRTPIYQNKILFSSLLIMTLICAYITLYPAKWLTTVLQLDCPPGFDFPIVVLCLALANFCASLFFEMFVIEYILFKKIIHSRRKRKHNVNNIISVHHLDKRSENIVGNCLEVFKNFKSDSIVTKL